MTGMNDSDTAWEIQKVRNVNVCFFAVVGMRTGKAGDRRQTGDSCVQQTDWPVGGTCGRVLHRCHQHVIAV